MQYEAETAPADACGGDTDSMRCDPAGIGVFHQQLPGGRRDPDHAGQPEIQEDFKDWTKTVSIENTEGSPVWIRARAYAGVTYPLVVTGESGWYDGGDGWWYYSAPVADFETTANLYVSITGIPAADAEDHQFASFNVAVVYESTRVHYGEDGEPLAADWNAVLDTGTAAPPAGGQD